MKGMLIFVQADTHEGLISCLEKVIEETKKGNTLYDYMESEGDKIIEVNSMLDKYDSMSSCLKAINESWI